VKIFTCVKDKKCVGHAAAFNKGQAVALFGKALRAEGKELTDDHVITEFDPEANKKGQAVLFEN
jgi:hypothetical protein